MAQSLHDIMDKSKLYTMIYSGVENESNFNLLYDLGIRDFLMSYHYIKEKNISMSKFKDKGVKFFIDSGAHTYQNDEKYLNYPLEYWERHLQGYLEWAEANKEYIFAIASFDFENLVGAEVVKEWYKKYFEPFMVRTGIPVCFVWHQNSHASWEQYCERYPYVGFSSVNTMGESIDLNEYTSKLKIAEKHNSLVHGFGMTRTSFLPKLPFFTSDSTTWLVGLQYGEINYWNGTKMSRLKKEKWKGEYLPNLVSLGLNREKLLAEDKEEMIKANIIPFIQAEEYIRTKLKSRMYWLKPSLSKKNIEDLCFPSVEWLKSTPSNEDVSYYANMFNISQEDMDLACTLVSDITVFLNWDDPTYQEYRDEIYTSEVIQQIHDTWVNSITIDENERIEDIQDFFKECVKGENDKLLLVGTNFDLVAKERDSYIEENLEETIDLDEEEFVEEVRKINPSLTAPEIDSMDEEIFSDSGLVTVRDEKGRFVKGQKKIKKPKNVYSDKYPKLVCNTCYASQTCPEFKAGYVCAYNKMFKRFDCRNTEDILEAMQGMVNMNMERMQRVAIFEMLDGGIPNGVLTNMIDQNMRLMMNMKQVMQQQEVIRQTRVVKADGTTTETTHVQSNQPGILERMFMNRGNKKDEEEVLDDDVIEVEGKEKED